MPNVTLEMIAEAGVVGAGGAGFPTHVKLAGKADTVLLNAAECEPLLHKDKEVLRDYLDANIEGLAIAMQLVGAGRAIVGIKNKYEDVIELCRARLPANMEVCPLRDAYPAGDEFILVYDALGRIIPPGGIPLAVNAVVMNVETAVNVAAAASQPVTEKFLTIAGAVAEPVTLRVPIGVTLSQCVAAAGGATVPDANYMVGGVMMGTLQADHNALVDKTTGGLIVLPDDHTLIRRRKQTWKQVAGSARARATSAAFAPSFAPAGCWDIRSSRTARCGAWASTWWARRTRSARTFAASATCAAFIPARRISIPKRFAQNKRRLAVEKKKYENPPFDIKRAETHLRNRKAPMTRLITKLGLRQFRNVGPLLPDLLPTDKVGIKLKQHIGAPCEPMVAVGERVGKGQVLGRPPVNNGKPAMGVPVHASIDGAVTSISGGVIWITK